MAYSLNSLTVPEGHRSALLFWLPKCAYLPRCNARRVHVTQEMETNLLTHTFALCLRVDEWATDTTILAGDLSMPVAKVNQLFKSLGEFVAQSSTFRGGNLLSPTARLQG